MATSETKLSVILMAWATAASLAVGAEAAPLELVGQWGRAGDTIRIVEDLAVSGHYVYLADVFMGVHVIDVSEPSVPRKVGFAKTTEAHGIKISGRYAYVADGDGGLQVLDLLDPAAPKLLGRWDTPGAAISVAVSGRYAYLGDWGNIDFQVIDVFNPLALQGVGKAQTARGAEAIAISGRYAFLAADGVGLEIVDISRPEAPQLVKTVGNGLVGQDVALMDSYLCVANLSVGLEIFSLADPAAPAPVGHYETSGNAFGVTTAGRYAYVADGWSGLTVLDLTQPSSPQFLGKLDTANFARRVVIADDLAYIADSEGGLVIMRVLAPPLPYLARAASRRTHGPAGPQDIDLPLEGGPGVEPRQNGSRPQLVLTCNQPPQAVNGEIECGQEIVVTNGTCIGVNGSENTLVVDMTFQKNACVTVSLSGLVGLTGNTVVSVVTRESDVDANGAVNILDLNAFKNQLGKSVDGFNCRMDVTVNGTINILDLQAAKSNLNQPAACP